MSVNDHKKNRAWHEAIGPGGLKCACCNPHHKGHSMKATKRFFNKKMRRVFKHIDRDAHE